MIVSLMFSVASGFVVSKFGNLKLTIIGTIIASLGFFVLFIFHSTEASIATVLILVGIGLALMQIGSVNVVLTSTPKQFSGISLGMNLLIYLIGSSVGPVIAGVFMQANQVTTNPSDSISTSYPSSESYSMIFLIATLISLSSVIFAILLNRKDSSQGRDLKELEVPR
jgi:MFS family permease